LASRSSVKEGLEKLLAAVHIVGTRGLLLVPKVKGGKIYPRPSFDKLNDYLLGDPDVGAAIDFISDVVMGTGMETSMNEKYTETTRDGRTAKDIVDNQAYEFGLDQVTQENVKDVVGYGNSVLWKNNTGGDKIEFLIRVLPSSIQNFEFDEKTGLKLANVNTQMATFPAERVLWFNYNRIGKTPVGIGILQALGTALKTEGITRKSFIGIKAQIQQSMADQIENFSAPNQMWVLPEAPDAKMGKYTAEIQRMKKGHRVVYNKPGATVVTAVPERMRGLDFYVETLLNSFFLALQTPLPKLFTSPGFTQASAMAAVRMGERKVYALQRYVKRVIETQIFASWIKAEGLDPVKAKVRLNWRMIQRPDVNVLLPIVLKARENRDLSQSEFRNILADLGLPIKPDVPVAETPLTGQKSELPPATQPLEKTEHKHKTRREIRTELEREEEEED